MKIESLRAYLLVWVLAPLAGVILVNVFYSYQAASHTADMVADRTLMASATDIAEEISVIDGVIDVQVPPAAIEMFNTGHGDVVYYRIHTRNGQLLAGYPDVPTPATSGREADPIFYSASFRGHPLRMIALTHPIVGADEASPVTVVVGQTLNSYNDLVLDLLQASIGQQLILLIVAAVVVLVGLRRGIAPLLQLRDAVLDEKRDALDPLPAASVQTELRPLVDALNLYKRRVRSQMAAQNRFIANAAHQIKTPLTLLATQAAFAERAKNQHDRKEALGALQASVRQFAHLVNQLLTLSRAEPGVRRPRHERVDLAVMARRVLEEFSNVALDRQIDLGFDTAKDPMIVTGDETMLREMIVNLVDNALRYTPVNGTVMVCVEGRDDMCVLTVADNGPGVPPDEAARVFERFYRVLANGGEGSGLGLAIVQEVVNAAGGTVTLATPPAANHGLIVTVAIPRTIDDDDLPTANAVSGRN
ncbi:sensor histidine kinase [Telmatospirillum sp.]|uniref:sensor histidine kinase n=1 Tax=Telmatospirillum sp. TaxID=2079197 RepID=UPI00283EF2AB|nr:sensor histidine kinase [Telmatospirillum sp.]MDR3437786.1 sensor histidine kinase [Telmatospirillum sp.]